METGHWYKAEKYAVVDEGVIIQTPNGIRAIKWDKTARYFTETIIGLELAVRWLKGEDI